MDLRSAVSRIDYYTQGLLETAKYSDAGREITWVIVESDDDCEVYGKFMYDDDNVKLRDSGCKEADKIGKYVIRKGWARVERLVAEYKDSLTIIGIRDKDYTAFVDTRDVTPGVFVTDCRDLEMMMIQTGILQRIITSPIRGRDFSDILSSVYEHTRVLGYMRIMNEVCALSCKFHDFLKMSLLWNQTTHSYLSNWKDALTSCFLKYSEKEVTALQFDDFVTKNNLDALSVYDVCRGHDVVNHLAWNLIENKYSQKNLTEMMKEEYSLEDFQRTALYAELQKWEQRNCRRVVK